MEVEEEYTAQELQELQAGVVGMELQTEMAMPGQLIPEEAEEVLLPIHIPVEQADREL